jgi:hypothetical protein
LPGELLGLDWILGKLHTARFSASANQDLRLNHDAPAEFFGDVARLRGGICDAPFMDAVSSELF